MAPNHFFIMFLGIVICCSCHKNQDAVTDTPQSAGGTVVTVGIVDSSGGNIYIAGVYDGHAAYWKNGRLTHLPDGGMSSSATGITVAGTDVFIAGDVDDLATYWKNDTLIVLDQNAYATSITTSAGDVYVAGYVTGAKPYSAVYWKNGQLTILADTAVAGCIKVSGTDVYVAGYTNGIGGQKATYWKNGHAVNLDPGLGGFSYSFAGSIAVDGNDVYVAGGDMMGTAEYWRNDSLVILKYGMSGGSGDRAYATSITISGSDVYIAGIFSHGSDVAGYWKNDRFAILGHDAWASSITTLGSDVYVAGSEEKNGSPYIAKYWKNGTPINLTDGSNPASANAIFVARR